MFSIRPSTGTDTLPNRSIARSRRSATAPGGRDDDCSVGPRFLDQRQLHVAGAGRQVDDQDFRLAPIGLDQLRESAPDAIGPRQASAWPGDTSWPSDRKLIPCASTGLRRLSSAVGFSSVPRILVCEGRRRRRRSARPSCPPGKRDGDIGRKGRFADPALAAGDCDELAARLARGKRDPDLVDSGHFRGRGVVSFRSSSARSAGLKAGGVGDDRRHSVRQAPRANLSESGRASRIQRVGFSAISREIGARTVPLATVFRGCALPINGA
jgi:hypothetical protein